MFALLALGLMAKPMLVTAPIVLLLLDYWPLGRVAPRRVREARNVAEDGALREAGETKIDDETRVLPPCRTHPAPTVSLHAPYVRIEQRSPAC